MKLIEIKENVYVPESRIEYITVVPDTLHVRFTVIEADGTTLGFSRQFNTEEELRGFFKRLQE